MKKLFSFKSHSEIKYYLIKKEVIDVGDFVLKYELYCSFKLYRESYNIKVTKSINGKVEKEAFVRDFEWRKKQAQNVFETIIRGEVTPHCLEDCVLELI